MTQHPSTKVDRTERDRDICKRWSNGESVSHIGKSYGLTHQRIRQIIELSPPDGKRKMSESFEEWSRRATAPMNENSDIILLHLRVHRELHARLMEAARSNYRTLPAEVMYRLLKSFADLNDQTEKPVQTLRQTEHEK